MKRDYLDEDTLVLTEEYYDKALVGVSDEGKAIYEYTLLVEAYAETNNTTLEEANEWVAFNVVRGCMYNGYNPIIMYQTEEE